MYPTRCDYTGEDGFEIQFEDDQQTISISEQFVNQPNVFLANLGLRDILRLESGLCLSSQDFNEQTSPREASLNWLMSKKRRRVEFLRSERILMEIFKQN
jgi:glycine cleavage system aminomethyltransferase T